MFSRSAKGSAFGHCGEFFQIAQAESKQKAWVVAWGDLFNVKGKIEFVEEDVPLLFRVVRKYMEVSYKQFVDLGSARSAVGDADRKMECTEFPVANNMDIDHNEQNERDQTRELTFK